MNFLKSALLFCSFSSILASCGGEGTTTNNGSNTPNTIEQQPTTAIDNRPKIYLEGYYATSTAAGYAAERLFDRDAKTGWRTQTGAGTDEGIMLYFSDNQQVKIAAVEATADPAAAFGDAPSVLVYVNGQVNNSGAPNSRIAIEQPEGNRPIRSMFLRVARAGTPVVTKKAMPQGEVEIQLFPKNQFVGFENLKFTNADGQEVQLVAPEKIAGKITAKTLSPEQAYSATHLFDSKKDNVWVEGDPVGNGEGEIITFEFEKPVQITALEIWNGYQRSENHYTTNARLKDFAFGETGEALQNYTLADRRAGQKISLSAAAKGTSFQLKIGKAYPGSKYKDLAISELVFFDGDRPFVLSSAATQVLENELIKSVAGSPAEELLNRRIFNDETFGGSIEQRSIILRTDGSFVFYSKMDDESSSAESLAEGNWELQSANATSAKIKIFGKWVDQTETMEPYKGNEFREFTKIFNDILTINKEKIVGGKMVGTFYLK